MEYLYCFISTGDKTMMYTLRVMTLDFDSSGQRVMRDYYIKNLSTNAAEAQRKAEEYCEYNDIQLKGGADFNLEEIRRISREQLRIEREAEEKERQEKFERVTQEFNTRVSEGVILIGKHKGKTAEEVKEVDIQYLFWLAGEAELGHSKLNISGKICKNYIEVNGIELPGFIGEIGEEVEIDLILKNAFWTNGMYPTLCWKCATLAGEMVTFFSVAKKFKELKTGQKFTVKGIIKDHFTSWNGFKSTTLNKPKKI